ncbi:MULTISPECIES: TetR/AcrR family transcriptional regulator [unclassified Mycolicibacterium]|uniref:TetR/AcrR family transcriptional regulator n=1 Tax=unclassified Mycolicibacterium TaxID=2636767 RepID=UPI001F4C116A|nr:TetR/AcrR family transcriptional regulator [Mycolicibacterium sp. YH-1]UNB52522.1 TetR/AcrR family transcriptional regulator [Mycolicibacterium sp. YH-1]
MKESSTREPSKIAQRRELARKERSAAWLEQRAQILAKAAEVFALNGFNGTSITDIANHLGVSQSNIYYYFGTKQEIFLELVRRASDYNVTGAEAIAAKRGSSVDRIAEVIELLASSYEEHYPFLNLYVQEDGRWLSSTGAELQQFFLDSAQRFEDAVMAIVEDGIQKGEFKVDLDARMVTYTVLGAVNWMHRWYRPGGELSGGEVGKVMSRILLSGIADTGGAP